MADEKPPESMLTVEQRKELVAALEKRGVPRACPMCGTNKWALGEGYFSNSLQRDFTSVNLGGIGIPSIPIICSNCGFISQHALGALGLLPKVEPK
jgi:predicted RNA-binding Zn-ribbon protein involved in translation (DUF1610 family)